MTTNDYFGSICATFAIPPTVRFVWSRAHNKPVIIPLYAYTSATSHRLTSALLCVVYFYRMYNYKIYNIHGYSYSLVRFAGFVSFVYYRKVF